jgi:acetyl esterase/lipase
MLQSDDILSGPAVPDGEKIRYGDDPLQFGELRVPPGDELHPVAIVIHGGFWRAKYNLDHISHLCAALNSEGIATWSLEYRRIGNPGGGWPGTFDDVRCGSAHIWHLSQRYNLDCERLIAIGHSAGGQLALWLGNEMKLHGVVALAPVADLRRAYELKLSDSVVHDLLGSPVEHADRYKSASPIERLPLRKPQRLIHGTLDDIVPVEISRRYVAAAANAGDDAVLIELKNAGHFELIDPRTTEFKVVRSTVRELCKTS